MYMRKMVRTIISLPKTIYVNFRILSFKEAVKLPFYVDKDIKLGKLHKNVVKLNFKPKCFSIVIGQKVIDGISENKNGYLSMSEKSKMEFDGRAEFSYGISLYTMQEGVIKFGRNFYCNKNCTIASRKLIKIGNDVLLGWNISIRDSDGGTHKIYEDGKEKVNKKEIVIGNHVWLCACSHILKGVIIPDDTVVAYNSCVTKQFEHRNTIIAGNPAKVVRTNVTWER